MEGPTCKKLKVDDKEDNPFVYEEGVTDVVLKVEDLEIHVNKGVLMTCSQVFKDMLLMCKDNEDEAKPIIIDDSKKSVLAFLRYIYPSVLKGPNSVENLDDILRLGDKYGVCTLSMTRCDIWFAEYLRGNFTKITAAERLAFIEKAEIYNLKTSMTIGLNIMKFYDCSDVHKSQLSDKVKLAISTNRLLRFETLFRDKKDINCFCDKQCCFFNTRDKFNKTKIRKRNEYESS